MADNVQLAAMARGGAGDAHLPQSGANGRLVAAGGIAGAIAATSCCILPLVLTMFGITGAWMSGLRALAPLQPYFIGATLAFLSYGFYLVYWRQPKACLESAACARPLPNRLVKGTLWAATILVIAALSFPAWFPLILPYLP